MKRLNTCIKTIPGLGICLIIAYFSTTVEALLPTHFIGASVIALFIGMLLNCVLDTTILKEGTEFTSKKILKGSIILLGASLNIQLILNIGSMSLIVMAFTLLTCFGGGYFIGKLLGLDWKLSNLISAGTGICGGSAIAAIAPVIDAKDEDIAYAMSATFLFDMIMILTFPFLGHLLGLDDIAYGLWAGTAINDTSSVVAASYAYSESAGDFATMVKLTRTLSIIPTVLIFSYINLRIKKKAFDHNNASNKDIGSHIITMFPWFILGFLFLALLNSIFMFPENITSFTKEWSKFFMVAALAAIGLNTNFKSIKKAGIAPMLHGFIISLLVVIVAIIVIWCMGLI